MSQPTNARLQQLFLPAQGKKLLLVTGESVRDLFYLGSVNGARTLLNSLHVLGSAAGFDVTVSFGWQGQPQFGNDEMHLRFESAANGTTAQRPDEPELHPFNPQRGRNRRRQALTLANDPNAATPAVPNNQDDVVPTPAAVQKVETAAATPLRTLIGQVDLAIRNGMKTLVVFNEPEELWHGQLTTDARDQLRIAANLGFLTEGHADSLIVFVVKPGRFDDFVATMNRVVVAAGIHRPINLPTPDRVEILEFIEFVSSRSGLLGNAQHVATEWAQRRWMLLSLHNALRSVASRPLAERRLEDVLKRELPDETPEEVLAEVDQLVGLQPVKEKLRNLLKLAEHQVKELRAGRMPSPLTTHLLFLGNPGTGKTEVAGLVARFLRAIGLRSNGEFVRISRTDVASQWNPGECIQKMRDLIDRATGGVLFVDEAYQLAEGDWMRQALETLMEEMEKRRDSLTVIFAGYEEQMQEIWKVNPGFKSRIPGPNWIRFPDYSLNDLCDIFRRMCIRREFVIDDECERRAERFLRAELLRKRVGNARGVRNLVDQIEMQRAQLGGDDNIKPEMIPEPLKYDADRVKELLSRFDEQFVGLNGLKEHLRKLSRRARDADESERFVEEPLHCRFVGPPGTGKTSAASQMGEIFYAMGLLSHGRVKVVNPIADLSSQFVGEYAKRVSDVFESARGGVLFIDEAYQLARQEQGRQIIDQIVQTLTSPSFADTVVIVAGYGDEMNGLFEANPGLSRRIPNKIVFEPMPVDALVELFYRHLEVREYVVLNDNRPTCDRVLKASFERQCVDPTFGNAGSVPNFVSEVLDRQSERVEATGALQERQVLPEDIGEAPPGPEDLRRLNDEFDQRFIGMSSVKDRLRREVQKIRMLARQGGALPKSPRMLFLGNPGTGKTTAATAFRELLQAAGCLTSDRFVATRGTELKGSYVGQTKDRVIEKFRDARGGVLLIDEVYSLTDGDRASDSYAKEAVDTLVGQSELPENSQTVIILAGYPEPLELFLETNDGLRRRFPIRVEFPDYSVAECVEILRRWLRRNLQGFELPNNPKLLEVLAEGIERVSSLPGFGNAGEIETLGERIREARDMRLFDVPEERWGDEASPINDDVLEGVSQWLAHRKL